MVKSDDIIPYDECLLEAHLGSIARSTRIVYLGVLLLVAGSIAALPLVKVGISVTGSGILRPLEEKHDVRPSVSGIVDSVLVRRGDLVVAGETLMHLRDSALRERAAFLGQRADERARLVADLSRLVGADPSGFAVLDIRSERLRGERDQLISELEEMKLRRDHAAQELGRVRAMAAAELIPRVELEDRQYRLDQAEMAIDLTVRRATNRWQSELTNVRAELREIESAIEETTTELALRVVVAPIGGTIEELLPLSVGSVVRGGDAVAVISPVGPLEAEIYVTTRDVGWVRAGMPIRIHVDAFNYSDWGHVPARVTSVGADFILFDETPMFRVRAELEREFLALTNGVIAELRKGMTVSGRFVVAERTLLQLLRDRAADWFDPRGAPGAVASAVGGRAS